VIGNSVLEELLAGRKMNSNSELALTYDCDLMGQHRSFARDLADDLQFIEGELRSGCCDLCDNNGLVLPSGICVSCQTKKQVPNPIYVKKGCQVWECKARVQEKCTAQTGLYPAGILMGLYPCSTYKSSRSNEMASLVKRVFIPTPQIDPSLWKRFKDFSMAKMRLAL